MLNYPPRYDHSRSPESEIANDELEYPCDDGESPLAIRERELQAQSAALLEWCHPDADMYEVEHRGTGALPVF